MQAVCLYQNHFGQYCEKPNQHTGNHRCRVFSTADATRAYERQRHAGDPRWQWVNNGWQTHDPELVAAGLRRLRASKRSGTPNGGYPTAFFTQ